MCLTVSITLVFLTDLNLNFNKMKMSEEQIKKMVVMSIIDNCIMELDNTGQERYSMDENQFGKCVDTLVKNINVIQCCMGEAEQLLCSCDNPNGFKEMEEGRETCSKCTKPY